MDLHLATARALLFQLGDHILAVPARHVREVLPMAQLAVPPGLPNFIEGFLNLSGTAIPVLRLDRLFHLAEQPIRLYSPLILLHINECVTAILADRVIELGDLDGAPMEPQYSFNGCVTRAVRVRDQAVHVLAVDRLLLEQERQRLLDFKVMEQKRLQAVQEPAR